MLCGELHRCTSEAWETLNSGEAARPVTGNDIEVGCGRKSDRMQRVLLFLVMRNQRITDRLRRASNNTPSGGAPYFEAEQDQYGQHLESAQPHFQCQHELADRVQ